MSEFRRVDAWLLAPAPAERLAAFRLLAGGFAVVYVAVRSPALWALTRRPGERFEGVGVLAGLDGPPARVVVMVLLTITLLTGVAFATGWRFSWTGPGFALALLTLGTFHSSWGQLLHFENLMVLHVLVLGFSPAADAWSLTAAGSPRPSPRYGWPLRLAAIITVSVYVIAGIAKLRIGGTEWLVGDTLRNHVAYSASRLTLLGGTPTPLAGEVIDATWLFPPMAVGAVLIELTAPLALVNRMLRNVWVTATIVMHVGILALLAVFFPYQALGFAFAPFFALEVAVSRVARLSRRRPVDRSIRGG